MKIAVAQLDNIVGDLMGNVAKMKAQIENAKNGGVDLLIFSDYALIGYPPYDLLKSRPFIEACRDAMADLAICTEGIGVLFGIPMLENAFDEDNIHISFAVVYIYNGEVVSIVEDHLLKKRISFIPQDYYTSGEQCVNTFLESASGLNIGICFTDCSEDLRKAKQLNENIELLVVFSEISADYRSPNELLEKGRSLSELVGIPVLLVNHLEATGDTLCSGGSVMIDERQRVIMQMKLFEQDFFIVDWDSPKPLSPILYTPMQYLEKALIFGVRGYFKKSGFKKAIFGLSGGLDSAIVAAIAVKALGAENVIGVMMPSEFSTSHSVADSERLALNIGMSTHIIPIKDMYTNVLCNLSPYFNGAPFDITEENIQARIRALVIMALSNKKGYVVLNTSNKSEAAVGYGTMYGDMCGALGVIADVYKTDLFSLATFMNREGEVIPEHIITKPPSAELRLDQKDSDSLPDYAILDDILLHIVEKGYSLKTLEALGYEPKLLHRVMNMVMNNEYKRFQSPPPLMVTSKGLTVGRRMPLLGKRVW